MHLLSVVLWLAPAVAVAVAPGSIKESIVKANCTTYHGFVNTTHTPHVAQYLGIPFAKPPVKSLRFLPPQPYTAKGDFNATQRQPSCSQWFTKNLTLQDLTPELQPPPPFSEDCLYLNIFTPTGSGSSKNGRKLPVDVWIHGGQLIWGGNNDEGTRPMRWIERSRSHIVVQTSYRMNVMGFPNAAGLTTEQQNAGIKDARMALEWVRDNIASFGGDPNQIVLHGESSGAAMVDMLEYGYRSDPIARGVIHESAVSSMLNGTASDPNHEHKTFTQLAKLLGCNETAPAAQLTCMQAIDQNKIETFLQTYADGGKQPQLVFQPIADGKTVFTPQQYKALYGSNTSLPSIMGTNNREGSTFVPYTSPANPGATPQLINDFTLWEVQCAVLTAIKQRSSAGVPTYMYFYSGNFTNISPEPWMGAYHFAELPLVFGAHADLSPPSPAYEYAVSERMQDLWLSFLRDPTGGPMKLGWPRHVSTGNGQMMHFAPGANGTAAKVQSSMDLYGECKQEVP